MNLSYPYSIEKQESGGFLVQFIDFEEAFTEGDTVEESAFNAAEVLTGILAYRLEKGETIPAPSIATTNYNVAFPSAAVQAAILLRTTRGDRPLSDIASVMKTSWAAAQRMENPKHWPNLKQLDRAAKALGKQLVISLE